MYKTASQNSQSRTDRILMKDMPAEVETIPDDERRRFLIDRINSLDATITSLPKKHPDRDRLGKQKFLLQTQLSALKQEGKRRPGLGQCFIDAAFRLLPRETYTAIMAEAKHVHDVRYRADDERAKAVTAKMVERHTKDAPAERGRDG